MRAALLLTAAMAVSAPAETYYSWYSPEIAHTISEYVVSGEYHEHLDYNGDGKLTIADVIAVEKHYQNNCRYGNEITFNRENAWKIAAENYPDELLYWEIDRVDGELCRKYELTVSDITELEIYLEFEGYSDTLLVRLNPFEERVTVIS